MDVDAAIGRVLMVAPPDDWLERDAAWFDDLRPAGVILFKRHIPETLEAARAAIGRLHAWAAAQGRPLLVAADEEGGFVTQVSHLFPVPPSARCLAWGTSPEVVREVYARYGARLRWLGLNVDFAPVCDVNDNPRNPVIGVRAFATDAETVRDFARAAAAGLRDAGVLPCLKHFPGHGDTDRDSHLTLPVLAHGRERLERVELVPFRALVAEVPLVMVAHLACPELGAAGVPATLSPPVATDLLRRDLGFQGVAVTDAMEMEGVAGVFGTGEAAVRALAAGCDLLLYCFGLERVHEARAALRAALASGRLPAARFEAAASRVMQLAARTEGAFPSRGTAETGLPDASDDAQRYEGICRAALHLDDGPGWRRFWERVAATGRFNLIGWNEGLLGVLADRFQSDSLTCTVNRPEAAADALEVAQPTLIVLAERRPLTAEAVAVLQALARAPALSALANLLTPEVDLPLRPFFPIRLQSADHTPAMLDALFACWEEPR